MIEHERLTIHVAGIDGAEVAEEDKYKSEKSPRERSFGGYKSYENEAF